MLDPFSLPAIGAAKTPLRRRGAGVAEAGAEPRVWRLDVPVHVSATAADRDLNAWRQAAGEAFADELLKAWNRAIPLGWERIASAAELFVDFARIQADVEGAIAMPTGVGALDTLLADGGWRPGVVLVGGLAGIGKSAFALFTALHAARCGNPVLYLSVEQGSMELLGRLFCTTTRRPIADYWNRSPAYLAAAQEAAGELPLANLYLRSDPYLMEDTEGTAGRVRR